MHQRSGLRHRGAARAGLCVLRAAAPAAMLLGTMTVGLSGPRADEDDGSYESPTSDFELTWDDAIWTVEDDVDVLVWSSDLMVANVIGYASGDGEVETSPDGYLGVLSVYGEGNAIVAVNPDTDEELVSRNGDGSQLTGFLIYRIDGDPSASLITCVSLDDEKILGVEFAAPGVEITTDEASAQIDDILDTPAF